MFRRETRPAISIVSNALINQAARQRYDVRQDGNARKEKNAVNPCDTTVGGARATRGRAQLSLPVASRFLSRRGVSYCVCRKVQCRSQSRARLRHPINFESPTVVPDRPFSLSRVSERSNVRIGRVTMCFTGAFFLSVVAGIRGARESCKKPRKIARR